MMATPRALVLAMYRAALDAADPKRAVLRALEAEPIGESRIHVLSLGKASIAMTIGALEALEDRVASCVVVAPHGADARALDGRAQVLFATHPIPDESSVLAGNALLDAAKKAVPNDCVLVLLSGGGSSLAEVPRAPFGLADLQRETGRLLANGAPISEMNAARIAMSAFKGGGLRRASQAPVTTFALSDVAGAAPRVIASGPTAIEGDDADIVVIGDGMESARAAARIAEAAGYDAIVDDRWMTGDAELVARELANLARGANAGHRPRAYLRVGECTVVLGAARGRGGRCQQMALAFACEEVDGATFAALSTDGIDGPTDAAGAIVDRETAREIATFGVDPRDALARRNAYPALDSVGALVRTGPSGTNVNDLAILLVTPSTPP